MRGRRIAVARKVGTVILRNMSVRVVVRNNLSAGSRSFSADVGGLRLVEQMAEFVRQ